MSESSLLEKQIIRAKNDLGDHLGHFCEIHYGTGYSIFAAWEFLARLQKLEPSLIIEDGVSIKDIRITWKECVIKYAGEYIQPKKKRYKLAEQHLLKASIYFLFACKSSHDENFELSAHNLSLMYEKIGNSQVFLSDGLLEVIEDGRKFLIPEMGGKSLKVIAELAANQVTTLWTNRFKNQKLSQKQKIYKAAFARYIIDNPHLIKDENGQPLKKLKSDDPYYTSSNTISDIISRYDPE